MSRVTYDAGTMTITVDGLEDVERALGDLKKKTPAAAKVAINATARQDFRTRAFTWAGALRRTSRPLKLSVGLCWK